MNKLIEQISIKNLLSFDAVGVDIKLKQLNVLIGANGSGKSNFIEAISLFQGAPKRLADTVRDSGGISTWLYKGTHSSVATIDIVTGYKSKPNSPLIHHLIAFGEIGNRFELRDEVIEDIQPYKQGEARSYFYYRFDHNNPVLNVTGSSKQRRLERADIDPEQSILSQRKDPDQYPELANLARLYEKIRIYREWTFGRNAMPRLPQRTDVRNDVLEEDGRNLGLVLNKISTQPTLKKKLLSWLQVLYPRFEDFGVSVEGGTAQIYFSEKNYSIPATRLSDGTLRYLTLLAALYNPNKRSLICIEEPELGLHPDVLPTIAQILKEVSQETQLIVTTHSDEIISALSDSPEDVIVCENADGATKMNRLDKSELSDWLQRYSLGELWKRGELGGNRF
jgi:predicted ATPase